MAALFGDKRAPDRKPMPFIVGVGRSGTTMLRLMLDAHPDVPRDGPDWLDLPALAQMTISSPELLRMFATINEGKKAHP